VAPIETFHVLGDRTRHAIVELLRDGELPVGELVDRLRISQPAVSKHLRVLRDAGLVEARVDAQRRLYQIVPEPFVELDEWLASFRTVWAKRLDRLESHLDRRRLECATPDS
jgi:DNA-binding transcriptional ArsR family regulator